jgi:hypothetical protein
MQDTRIMKIIMMAQRSSRNLHIICMLEIPISILELATVRVPAQPLR